MPRAATAVYWRMQWLDVLDDANFQQPEVVCTGPLPIRTARSWRDGRGLWHPMGEPPR
jgi:hypothetical protein